MLGLVAAIAVVCIVVVARHEYVEWRCRHHGHVWDWSDLYPSGKCQRCGDDWSAQ